MKSNIPVESYNKKPMCCADVTTTIKRSGMKYEIRGAVIDEGSI
jgi:hypothetical protein